MNAHELATTTVENSWTNGFKQLSLELWLKVKRVFKSIERSLDKTHESEMRGW